METKPTIEPTISRRGLLRGGLGAACSLAAHPLVTPMVLAAAPTDERLVVILLRGGIDGLDIVQPYGDPHLGKLRPVLAKTPDDGLHDLDGFFGLHEHLGALHPLWKSGELAFAHAVATPYRDKRSHFEGQDALENGTGSRDGMVSSTRDGWLNRALAHIPGATAETALVVGGTNMLMLAGDRPTTTWRPGESYDLGRTKQRLLEKMYHDDPLFREAFENALTNLGHDQGGGDGKDRIANYIGQRLREDCRIVAFSRGGWDTHSNQHYDMKDRLPPLAKTLLSLKSALGPVWAKTTVIALTEFGRTARQNGSVGTDHGTGGALLMMGGGLAGGRVLARWPGLSEKNLYQNRDLLPTRDLRSFCAWLLHAKFGLTPGALENEIFPGLDMEDDPRLIG